MGLMSDKPLAERPWEHRCNHGTRFTCKRCDFTQPIIVEPISANVFNLLQDVAEMIGFHAKNIHPELPHFAGYDCITFQIKPCEGVTMESLDERGWSGAVSGGVKEPAGHKITGAQFGIAVGKFVLVWRDEKTVVEILSYDKETHRVAYRCMTGDDTGEKYSAMTDESQVIRVFDTAEEALANMEKDGDDE